MYFHKRKKSELKKKCPIFAGLIRVIGTFDLHSSGERAENAIFQSGQTHKNRGVERGRSVELKSSTPCPPI